ncbi:MAG: tyrosine--tRNA ligase [Phycisphaerales bacterium]
MPIDLIDELTWRGLVHQCTDEQGLRAHLAGGERRVYAGFDPTADSLTIGNLVPIMMLAHVKRAGHTPVVVMGGGTGLIGDPSGKSAERQLNTIETVRANVDAQRPIFENVLGKVDGPDHTIVNNHDWLAGISYLEMLRDVGKHFSVNMMMAKESVRARLEDRDQGISYTEFSYMILQAYDFLHLYRDAGVTVQFGGSDQFGNIVAGIDLIRRIRAMIWAEVIEALDQISQLDDPNASGEFEPDLSLVLRSGGGVVDERLDEYAKPAKTVKLVRGLLDYWEQNSIELPGDTRERVSGLAVHLEAMAHDSPLGFTAPLVQKADGGKFGKTESGAVWLTAARTSPYAYHQFWLNASDADVIPFLKTFTFLDRQTIADLEQSARDEPFKREAQKALADEATRILHGDDELARAKAAGQALFSGDIGSLDERTLTEVLANVPSSDHAKADLAGEGADPVALLVTTGLAKSNREAREFLSNGSVSVNGEKIGPDDRIAEGRLLHGSLIALRRGKKSWHLTRWA